MENLDPIDGYSYYENVYYVFQVPGSSVSLNSSVWGCGLAKNLLPSLGPRLTCQYLKKKKKSGGSFLFLTVQSHLPAFIIRWGSKAWETYLENKIE